MKTIVKRLLGFLTALTLCSFVAAAPGQAKEKAPSKLQARTKTSAVTKQARLIECGWLQAGVAQFDDEMQTDSTKHLGLQGVTGAAGVASPIQFVDRRPLISILLNC